MKLSYLLGETPAFVIVHQPVGAHRQAQTYVFLLGMRKDISEPATRVQTLQRISKTAGQHLALPVYDGIIWKQSSQYSGPMSIYLQGICHPFHFISACTYGALLQGRPTGKSVFSRMPEVYLYSSVHLSYDYAAFNKADLLSEQGRYFSSC